MPKKMMKKSVYLGVFILFLSFVVSCEKDFTDIGTSVINNTKFETKEIYLEIEMSSKDIQSVRADNLTLGTLGEYQLGVYKKSKGIEKKIEASIISQLTLPNNLTIFAGDLETGQTLSDPNIDEVILKIPLKATRTDVETVQINVGGVNKDTIVPVYKIDSLIGDTSKNFTLNVFQSKTYLSRLNPVNPAVENTYQSDAIYLPEGTKLNVDSNFNFTDVEKDTLFVFDRTLSNGQTYKDTLKVENGSRVKSNPFIAIKLDKNRIKSILLDKYGESELSTQDLLNNYFRGVIIEATGTDGAMLPLNLSVTNNPLRPSIDIIHTSTILDASNNVVDTIAKVDSFFLGGIENSIYKTSTASNNATNTVVVQGTSGSFTDIKILGVKISNVTEAANPYIFSLINSRNSNNDGYLSLDELVNIQNNEGILINDVSLDFYINKNAVEVDTTNAPKRLFLFKNGAVKSQIRDILTDGPNAIGGALELSDSKPNKYKFKITEYISYILDGGTDYLPNLGLKVFNTTDVPSNINDTIVDTYNWNPRSVPILDHNVTDITKKARIKISYTIKK